MTKRKNNPFRKIRALNDTTLNDMLGNHSHTIRAIVSAVTMLLRERRYLLAWGLTVTAAIIWMALHAS